MTEYKVVRAQRPQTKNNYELIVVKETEKQFKGIEVSQNISKKDKEKYGVYSVISPPTHDNRSDLVSTLNKFHCTNYVETKVKEEKLGDYQLEIIEKVKNKIYD